MRSLLKAIETIDAVAEAGSAGIRELSSIIGTAMRVSRIGTSILANSSIPAL
jgi:hypothetical protein